ncbi:AsmA-like C-terminal region-containing protein [Propylenella binzhouense]|uniref:DUF3971 domain-containing protein n=1 Tax=Propylenella binzhouense TaxID=2555902 RepID=A0A964T2J3_9HYPH|nr:AsmA-like C-terminal region-containing protein [Propylenella binzhouense]MYZ47190.1 hypothetical protein [Propylenella binzhouense]
MLPLTRLRSSETGPVPPLRRRFRWAKRACLSVAILIVAAFVGVGILVYQISAGTIESSFLRDRIAAAIAARLPAGSQLSVGRTTIGVRRGEGLAVDAGDIAIAIPDGLRLRATSISTLADVRAIVSGRIDLNSIKVAGLELTVPIPGETAPVENYVDEVRRVARLVGSQIAAADRTLRKAGLEDLAVADATLRFAGAPAYLPNRLAISDASWMPFQGGRSKVWLALAGEAGPSSSVTLEYGPGAEGSSIAELAISDLTAGMVVPELGDADAAPGLTAPADLRATIAIGESGDLLGATADLLLGAGEVRLSEKDKIALEHASFELAIPAAGDTVALRRGEIRTGGAGFVFAGGLTAGGTGDRIRVAGRLGSGFVEPGGTAGRVNLAGGSLALVLDAAKKTLAIEKLEVIAEKGNASVVGQLSLDGPAAGLSLAVSASEMPAETLRALWPPFVSPKARDWVAQHVISGVAGPATISVALPLDHLGENGRDKVLPSYGIVSKIPFRDAVFTPLDYFPPVSGGRGEVELANATATIRAEGGQIAVPGRGEIDITGTELSIPELGRPGAIGIVSLKSAGPVRALATLADTPPFDILARRGIPPDTLSGTAKLELRAVAHLEGGLLDEVVPELALSLKDFAGAEPIEGKMIEDGDLVLKGAQNVYTLTGEARIEGMKASLDLTLGDGATGTNDITLTLDDAARRRLGIDLGELLKGPVEAVVTRVDETRQAVKLDLTKARIRISALGWEKGPGVPAKATMRLDRHDDEIVLSDFKVDGEGFGADGEAVISGGRLSSLALKHVKLRPEDDFAVTAKATGSGYLVEASGESFDARALLAFGSGGGSKSETPITLNLAFDRVVGQSGTSLEDLDARLKLSGQGISSMSLEAGLSGGNKVTGSVTPDGAKRRWTLHSTNGGALLRFAGIYEKLSGGELSLDFLGGAGEAPGSGLLRLVDFRVLNEKALAEVIKHPAGPGRRGAAQGVQPGAMSFTELHVPFRTSRGDILIDDAYLRGPSLGGTGAGTIDIDGRKLTITGTLVPAFGLNNIAGALPIIGAILGGGRNEGLVGITFKLDGPLDAPTMSVNPMSAIAPGILRKLFAYQ